MATRLFSRIALLLILLPLIELALLLWIAQHTSWQAALLLAILPSLLGVSVIRQVGAYGWHGLRRQMAAGRVPVESFSDNVFTFAAGMLLLVPGVLTDLAGLALLMPPVRRLVKYALLRYFHAKVVTWSSHVKAGHDKIIDVKVIEPAERLIEDQDRDDRDKASGH